MYGIDNSSTVSGHCAGGLISQNEITYNKKYNLLFIYRTNAILKNTIFFKSIQKTLSNCKTMARNFHTPSLTSKMPLWGFNPLFPTLRTTAV